LIPFALLSHGFLLHFSPSGVFVFTIFFFNVCRFVLTRFLRRMVWFGMFVQQANSN